MVGALDCDIGACVAVNGAVFLAGAVVYKLIGGSANQQNPILVAFGGGKRFVLMEIFIESSGEFLSLDIRIENALLLHHLRALQRTEPHAGARTLQYKCSRV